MNAVRKVTPDGRVSVDWLEAADGPTLASWVRAVLLEADPDMPLWRSNSLHRVVIEAYSDAPEGARKVMREAVRDFVIEMADDGPSVWSGLAGDRLLLVAGEVCGQAIAPFLRRMVVSGMYVDVDAPVPGDIHARLLQTIGRLGVQEPPEFWLEQARIAPQKYLPAAMRGLHVSAANPLGLLGQVQAEWSPALLADIRMVVSVMEAQEGTQWMRRCIAECYHAIPPEVLRALPQAEGVCPAAGPQSQPERDAQARSLGLIGAGTRRQPAPAEQFAYQDVAT